MTTRGEDLVGRELVGVVGVKKWSLGEQAQMPRLCNGSLRPKACCVGCLGSVGIRNMRKKKTKKMVGINEEKLLL